MRTVRKIGSRSYLLLMGTAGPALVNQRCMHIFLDQVFIVPDTFSPLVSLCCLEVLHLCTQTFMFETSDLLKIKNQFHDNSFTKDVKNLLFSTIDFLLFSPLLSLSHSGNNAISFR